jgi:hypothetical protein
LRNKLDVHVLDVDLLLEYQHAENTFFERVNLLGGSCS